MIGSILWAACGLSHHVFTQPGHVLPYKWLNCWTVLPGAVSWTWTWRIWPIPNPIMIMGFIDYSIGYMFLGVQGIVSNSQIKKTRCLVCVALVYPCWSVRGQVPGGRGKLISLASRYPVAVLPTQWALSPMWMLGLRLSRGGPCYGFWVSGLHFDICCPNEHFKFWNISGGVHDGLDCGHLTSLPFLPRCWHPQCVHRSRHVCHPGKEKSTWVCIVLTGLKSLAQWPRWRLTAEK